MFRTRPRGFLRTAALLAIGASPLLAGVSAAAPAPSLDGLEGKVGDAPELITNVADKAGTVANGKTVKLPTPTALPQPAAQLPDAAHALPGLPAAPAVPSLTGKAKERAFPAVSALPAAGALPVNQLPVNKLPNADELPIQLSQLGGLPIALPGLG